MCVRVMEGFVTGMSDRYVVQYTVKLYRFALYFIVCRISKSLLTLSSF
jgi:hypothetical protein